MLEAVPGERRGIASFSRSLFRSWDSVPLTPLASPVAPAAATEETLEMRKARIQAQVDTLFAALHPEEFRFRGADA
jgi:hypothetical protein